MKLLLVVVGLVVAASAESEYAQVWKDYHEEFGIPEADRIRQAEESMDFDGARIVGGAPSSLGQHPHLCGLVITLTTNQEGVCGSSLISNNRLVTAAHCWRHGNSQGRSLVAVLGSLRVFTGGTRVTSTNVQLHASYNQGNLNNDIAIIVIGWVSFTNHINRINLASGNANFIGNTATASGFGKQGDNQGIPQNQALRHVQLQVVGNQLCVNQFGAGVAIASTLCASGPAPRGTCTGDSGGPLDVGTGGNRQLIGITSLGYRRCELGRPIVFTRITSFNAWIRQRM